MSISIESGNTSTRSAAGEFEVVDLKQVFFGLIPSRFPPITLYERITRADSGEAIAELEAMTNPRLREKARLLNNVDAVDVDSPKLQNWNHAPFAYLNPEGTRYFDSTTPVLELFDDLQTALAVSVGRRESFLARTGEKPMGLDMRVLSRPVTGRFADLTAWDPDMDQTVCWRRAAAVRDLGLDGVLFRPAERPSAQGVAILNREVLGRAVQGDHFRYVWDGQRIRSLYGFRDGVTLQPDDLRSSSPTSDLG